MVTVLNPEKTLKPPIAYEKNAGNLCQGQTIQSLGEIIQKKSVSQAEAGYTTMGAGHMQAHNGRG
jgi:hypothetical protein